jgi:hypothetical protein
MYARVFTKILDSTIWLEPTPTRIAWITLLASMDEDGFAQFAGITNLAHRARLTVAETAQAIKALEAPDHDDPLQDHQGRRVERVPGGWMILNASKYNKLATREIAREQNRLRVARHRERMAQLAGNAPVRTGNAVCENVSLLSVALPVAVAERIPTESLSSSDAARPVEEVFEHWKREHGHPKAKLDPRRSRVIREALKRFSKDDLMKSISGYLHSEFHMGKNDRRKKFDEIATLLRDAPHIERGIEEFEKHLKVADTGGWRPLSAIDGGVA